MRLIENSQTKFGSLSKMIREVCENLALQKGPSQKLQMVFCTRRSLSGRYFE